MCSARTTHDVSRLHHFILAVTDREAAADYFVELLELEGHYPNGVFSRSDSVTRAS